MPVCGGLALLLRKGTTRRSNIAHNISVCVFIGLMYFINPSPVISFLFGLVWGTVTSIVIDEIT